MMLRISASIVAACLLLAPVPCAGQTTGSEITFKVPVNLTQLTTDISKVAVFCYIQSAAIQNSSNKLGKQEELPVVGGKVVTTASVVIVASPLDNPLGKPATYGCLLSGFSLAGQRWDAFSETQPTVAFRLSPTPPELTGSFIW